MALQISITVDGSSKLKESFASLASQVLTKEATSLAAEQCRISAGEADILLTAFVNEAGEGLSLILPFLRPGMRILEIGAGIGLLSRFLAEQGFEVVAIEPAAEGFSFMSAMSEVIGRYPNKSSRLTRLPIGAENLDPKAHGKFDLIFSFNVVEHIADLDEAFRCMTNVLAPNGTAVHQCPNYTIPYEPHFGIPLVPGFPAATRYLYPSVKTRHPGLWESLNFVTVFRLRKLAQRNGLNAQFTKHTMLQAVERLQRDPIFRERHPGLINKLISVFSSVGILNLLRYVPPAFSTPMIVQLHQQDSPRPPAVR